MARVFVSFAIEDRGLRNLLVGQKINTRTRIDFTDYSVREPWSQAWKTNCRMRIRQCAGVIGIITRNTPRASGQLWELKCAYQEGLPTLLIHGHPDTWQRLTVMPKEIAGRRVLNWTEDNIVNFLNRL